MRRTYKDCHRRYNYKIVCKGKSGRDFYDEKFEHMWACKYPESALFIYDKHYNDALYQTIRANGGVGQLGICGDRDYLQAYSQEETSSI